ncbi:hypothetical protein FOA52_006630 [Chlamydomonas sp. UWO 241]|nr:hypothetical protein FOA52_006630 [Chlamydomonas sp. UWO 241]
MLANKARRAGHFVGPHAPPEEPRQQQRQEGGGGRGGGTSQPAPQRGPTGPAQVATAGPPASDLLEEFLEEELQRNVAGAVRTHHWTARGGVTATAAGPGLPGASDGEQGGGTDGGNEDEEGAAAAARAAAARDGRRSARGAVVPPPDTALPPGHATAALPPLPGPPVPEGAPPPPPPLVFVFWDLEDKHPGSVDPRLVVHRLRAVAGTYGKVCGVYAYATRKVSNWVPDAMMEAVSEARLAAAAERAARREAEGREQVQPAQQQAQVQRQDSWERHVCPVCGVVRRSEGALQAHFASLHGRRQSHGSGGAGGSGGGGGTPVNGPSRATGAVRRYHAASGAAFTPPPGHQLSLRYVLRCEGVDARVAQNADEDSGSSLAGGLSKLAQQLARGELPAAAGVSGMTGGVGGRPVVLLVSDDARLARLVGQLAAAGVGTVAASSRVGRGGGGGTDARPLLHARGAQNADEDSGSSLAGGLSKLAQQLAAAGVATVAASSRVGGGGGSATAALGALPAGVLLHWDALRYGESAAVEDLAVALAWKWLHISSRTADCDDASSTVLRSAPLPRLRTLKLYVALTAQRSPRSALELPAHRPPAGSPPPGAPVVGDLGLDVLTSGLIFAYLWGMLDRADKKVLRLVSRDVRELVDAAVDTLDMRGASEGALAIALAWKWPHVSSLTASCDDASSTVLIAAPLPLLRSLALYAVQADGDERWFHGQDQELEHCSMPVLSRTASAGLQDLRLINDDGGFERTYILSIQAVSSNVLRSAPQPRLRKLELYVAEASEDEWDDDDEFGFV